MSFGRLQNEPEPEIPVPDYVDGANDKRTVNNDVRHQYRVLSDEEKAAMVRIKDLGLVFLTTIADCVPSGREAALAKTKIEEEAVMWAVKWFNRVRTSRAALACSCGHTSSAAAAQTPTFRASLTTD